MVQLKDYLPCFPDLVGVARPDRNQPGHRAHVRELLDGLMSRAILTDSNRVVSEDVNHRNLHQGAQAERSPHVVDEDEESGAERTHFHQAHSVQDRAHGVLPDSEMEIAPGVILGRKVAGACEGKPGLRGGRQIGGPADQPRNVLGHCVQHRRRGLACGQALRVRGEFGEIAVPAFRKLAVLHAKQLVGKVGIMLAILSDSLKPGVAQILASLTDPLTEVIVDPIRHVEFLVFGPAVVPFGETNLILAQRLAVGAAGILLVRRAIADVAVDDDQRRPVVGALKGSERAGKHLEIVRIAHPGHVPPVADEAGGHIFRESQSRIAFDGDVIVVVNPAEIGESQMSRERCSLAGDPLHHASISAKRVDVEVEQFEAGAVVSRCQPLPGDRHPDAGSNALAERSRCGLDARCPAILGMAGTAAIQLPECFQGVQRYRGFAEGFVILADRPHLRQMQQRVEQRGRVADREDESVAIGPYGVLRVEAQELLPQAIGHRRHRHGGSRMTGVRRLDCIHGEGADRIDAGQLDPEIRTDTSGVYDSCAHPESLAHLLIAAIATP